VITNVQNLAAVMAVVVFAVVSVAEAGSRRA
jgi:hypothetical protein